jgi:CheY-like chemotaxis protein
MAIAGQLAGLRILVIEDDFLVGETVLAMLEDEGADVVGPIGSVDEALAFVAEQAEALSGVVLDLNLHGTKSYPIADALMRRKVPFVFMTGYGRDALDEAHRNCPHCIKPATRHVLLAALMALVADGRGLLASR